MSFTPYLHHKNKTRYLGNIHALHFVHEKVKVISKEQLKVFHESLFIVKKYYRGKRDYKQEEKFGEI